MEKIVAEIFVPAINKSFDFVLPCFMNFKQLTGLVLKAISEHEGLSFNEENILLFLNDTGEVMRDYLDISQTKAKDCCRFTII